MYTEDQNRNNRSGSLIAVHEGTGNGVELRENFSLGKDYALKVRKPYTITKQRQKWTEKEHKKFLEALKLYGRAWKKIQEHVGSKTAVQIRSHAQKFLSKVICESYGSSTSTTRPIEIPPPRPKRKPTHPYPRKLSYSLTKEHKMPERPVKPRSQELYALKKDNQSPTSVLSAVGSDTVAAADSDLPNCSLSPVSSASSVNRYKLVLYETNSVAERIGSPSPGPGPIASVHDKQTDKKLELLSSEGIFTKDLSAEDAPGQSIKLFGNTILVSDSHKQTSRDTSLSPDVLEVKPVCSIPKDLDAEDSSFCNSKCATLPHALRKASNIAPLNSLDFHSATYATPCWTLSEAGSSSPFIPYNLYRGNSRSNCRADHEKEIHKEGSLSGSNTGPVDQGKNSEKVLDAEKQTCQLSPDLELKNSDTILKFKPCDKSPFSQIKTGPTMCSRGFVPYKRCLAERDTAS